MKRALLVLLILAGATASVPALRTRAAPILEPVGDRLAVYGAPVAAWALRPMHRWRASNETQNLAREYKERFLQNLPVPQPAQFQRWAETRVRDPRGVDPWGQPYFLRVSADSIVVGSPGPDGRHGTEDDVVFRLPRR